jgi:hypothetical protein
MNIINKDNIVLVTTTINNNTISEKRKENIKCEMNKYKIPIYFIYGILEKNKLFFNIFKNRIFAFKQTNLQYGILCDDDFHPHPNFLEELNKTVNILPVGWRCLHLCPGYLWGRKFRTCIEAGALNPENNISELSYHDSKRYFINCGSGIFYKKQIWLGGPIAVLVNKDNVDSLLTDYINCYIKYKKPNDVILTQILNNNDYICMSPQLGYENEQGGVTK